MQVEACAWLSIQGRQASGMTSSGNGGGTARCPLCRKRRSNSGHGVPAASAPGWATDMTHTPSAPANGAVRAESTDVCGEHLLWAMERNFRMENQRALV